MYTGPKDGSDDNSSVLLIAGAAGGAIVVITMIIVLLCVVVVLVKQSQKKMEKKDYTINSSANNLGGDVTLKPNPSYGIGSTIEHSSKDQYELLTLTHMHSYHSDRLPTVTVTDEMLSASDVVDSKTNESQNYYEVDRPPQHYSSRDKDETGYLELIQKAT